MQSQVRMLGLESNANKSFFSSNAKNVSTVEKQWVKTGSDVHKKWVDSGPRHYKLATKSATSEFKRKRLLHLKK